MHKQQNKTIAFVLAQQTYRWLVSINSLQNTGQIDDKNMVTVSLNKQQANQLENGYKVALILKDILQKQKLNIPSSLNNLRNDQSKNSKINNWNFIWLTFDQIQVQFDPRIKDLIVQGEIVLVGQVLKQLCEHDFHRDLTKMNQFKINAKVIGRKSPDNKQRNKAALDLKKINLKKNPSQANSSLQLLILLLTSSLNMSLQQILGLFTNQNKYLAHVIVKGVNQDFNGIILFYSLLNKHREKIEVLHKQDPQDTYACFHAIKPGFLSKEPKVVDLTIELFGKLNNMYNWFISQTGGSCVNTIILGIKRHPSKAQQYFSIFSRIIQGREVDFFRLHFKNGFQNSSQLIQLTSLLIRPMAESPIIKILQDNQIFNNWLQTAEEIYETDIENKIIVIKFVCQLMCWTPEIIQKNQLILHSIGLAWTTFSMFQFTTLFNQLLIVLEKLAEYKNTMARKIYNIIIDIFTAVHQISDKKQYVVSTFLPFLAQFPTIPSQLLIQNYRQTFLTSSDFLMICQAVDIAQEFQTLTKIGQTLKDMFLNDTIINSYMGALLCQICKKIYIKNQEDSFDFVLKLIKGCLSTYSGIMLKKKVKLNNLQPLYNQNQKAEKKQAEQKSIKEKACINIASLVEKLISIISKEDSNKKQNLQIVKYQLMDTNSHIKNQNFKTGSKQIATILYKRFQLTRQEENSYDESFKKRANINRQEAALQKKAKNNSVLVVSRLQGPEHLKKQFQQIVQKRKRDEQMRQQEQIKKKKQEELKKILYKKQLQKMNLIKGGFGDGEAQLKQEGFWNKFIKQTAQVQIIPHDLIEDIHLQSAQLILSKYQKLFRYMFLNYSSTMHSTRSVNNFQDNLARKQILSAVQIIKMLKDYNFMFLTNSNQVQGIVRDINVKILKRKQIINELDFHGFQQFIRQFCLLAFIRPHSVTINKKNKIHNDFSFMSLPQLVQQFIFALKNSFKTKGQPVTFFQEAEVAQNTQNQEVRQLNQQLTTDPNMILPQGFKKIIDKKISFYGCLGTQVKLSQSYNDALEIVDQLMKKILGFSVIESISYKQTKVTAKPLLQLNVKQRNPNKIKIRALSTMIDRKVATESLAKIISKNDFSKGIKQGIAKLPLSEKLIGQNVGIVLQEIIRKIQNQNQTSKVLPKNKSIRDIIVKPKNTVPLTHRRAQSVAINQTISSDKDLKKLKNNVLSKNKLRPSLEDQQQKIKQTQENLKKKKLIQEKLMIEHKARMQQRRKRQQEQINRKLIEAKQRKEKVHKNKQKFQQFNKKQVQSLKKQFQQVALQKKKQQQIQQAVKETKQEKYRRLRTKIQNNDKIITQIRKQTNEKIMDLYHKNEIQNVFKQYQPSLKATYDFLIRNTYLSLTERKHKNQIIYQTWNYFNSVFQISPLIVQPKDIVSIFKTLTKEKQISKQYLVGLNYEQFLQALLRQSIKHKTIFNKIALKIRQQDDQSAPINEFQEQQEFDVKKLLKEQDIRDDIYDHYGDVQKVTQDTVKGLIYYLKVPFTKKGQQKRFRQILARQSKQSNITNLQKLKQKLSAQYTLQKKGTTSQVVQKPVQKPVQKRVQKQKSQIKVNQNQVKQKEETKQEKNVKQVKQTKTPKQIKQVKEVPKQIKQTNKLASQSKQVKGKQKEKSQPRVQASSVNKLKKK